MYPRKSNDNGIDNPVARASVSMLSLRKLLVPLRCKYKTAIASKLIKKMEIFKVFNLLSSFILLLETSNNLHFKTTFHIYSNTNLLHKQKTPAIARVSLSKINFIKTLSYRLLVSYLHSSHIFLTN